MGRALSEGVWREREAVVERCRASGLAMAEFARREGTPYAALLSWRKRFAAREDGEESRGDLAASPFREVAVEADSRRSSSSAACDAPVEIALACGAVVRLREGASVSLVRAALEALAPC
jgi:transposase-like protein